MSAPAMRIEVVYALPNAQDLVELNLAPGATVADAVQACGVLLRHPDLKLAVIKVGIYGRSATLTTILRDQDRVEIYRPLQIDPKDARRRRADVGKRFASTLAK